MSAPNPEVTGDGEGASSAGCSLIHYEVRATISAKHHAITQLSRGEPADVERAGLNVNNCLPHRPRSGRVSDEPQALGARLTADERQRYSPGRGLRPGTRGPSV